MKRRSSLIALAVAFIMTVAPLSIAYGLETAMQAFSMTSVMGQPIRFSQRDFTSRVSDRYVLEGIVITELPDSTEGVLTCGGRELLSGEAVTVDALSDLQFVPHHISQSRTVFRFLPVFSTNVGEETVQVELILQGKSNRAPIVSDFELKTYKNMAVSEHFKASDPDNDAITFQITVKPKRGQAEISPDGMLIYTPYLNKTGKDSLKYTAIDAYGNKSGEATVSIKIEKPSSKMSYADMNGNPAHYAALKLAEKEIFSGEMIGGNYYFKPDEVVSRGDLIVMAAKAAGLEVEGSVTLTGFADDAAIAEWYKPYALAALKAGLIQGSPDPSGGLSLNASREATMAEAAVIVSNILDVATVESEAVFANAEAIPVWAQDAAVKLETLDVARTDSEGVLRLEGSLTRAEAATLLLKAVELNEKTARKGLLSWAFGG